MGNSTVGASDIKGNRSRILHVAGFTVLLVMSLVAIVFETHLFGDGSVFDQDISSNGLVNSIFRNIPTVFTTCQVAFLSTIAYLVLKRILVWAIGGNRSRETAVRMVLSFLKYLMAIVTVLYILGMWGVDTTTLVASAGIISLVIGLGAQSLIADILAGMFIVFEQEFKVGDVVIVDEWRGTVQDIGIRCTKIVDIGGDVKIINNSAMKSIVNQSRGLSVARTSVGIDYSESLPRVELVIRDNLERMRRNIPYILDGPYYKGVSRLGDSSVELLIYAGCEEDDLLDVERCMNRELKLIFEENDISIPFPQVVLNRPGTIVRDGVGHPADEARAFLRDQLEKSKGLEEED